MTREQEYLIVQQVLEGNTNAFEELVLEYEKKVYNVALRILGNSEDAADMTQEAYIKAFNSLSGFRGDSKFSVWLTRIVSNLCLDFLRSRSRRPTVSLSVEDDEGDDVQLDIAEVSQSPELLLVFIEMNGCFQLLCIQLFEKECIFNTTRKKIKQDLLQLTGIDGSTKCRESYMESGDDPVIEHLTGRTLQHFLPAMGCRDQTTFSGSLCFKIICFKLSRQTPGQMICQCDPSIR